MLNKIPKLIFKDTKTSHKLLKLFKLFKLFDIRFFSGYCIVYIWMKSFILYHEILWSEINEY